MVLASCPNGCDGCGMHAAFSQHVALQPGRLLTEFGFHPAFCTSARPLAARDWDRLGGVNRKSVHGSRLPSTCDLLCLLNITE